MMPEIIVQFQCGQLQRAQASACAKGWGKILNFQQITSYISKTVKIDTSIL